MVETPNEDQRPDDWSQGAPDTLPASLIAARWSDVVIHAVDHPLVIPTALIGTGIAP